MSCLQVKRVLEEGRKKWVIRYNPEDGREEFDWRKFVLVEYENYLWKLWENPDEMEQCRGFRKAYAAFKESAPQRRKRREATPDVEVVDLTDESGRQRSKYIETSVFHKEVHPLPLHLTTLTVGRSTRLYEVGIVSILNRNRDESFHEKARYVDMQYMGAEREELREKSGLCKSDFYGRPGQAWISGANIWIESKLIRKVYNWLRRNVRSGEPLWITINSASLALFHQKMRKYQGENKDWGWVVGGYTTWNRIQKLFRMVAPDGSQDGRTLKVYQEEELRLDHVSSTAKDVAFNMVKTIDKVASDYFIKNDLERNFVRRNGDKNWRFFANQTCLEGSRLPAYRGHKSYHKKVELWDYYNETFHAWTWNDLEVMKAVVKRGNDLLPESAPRKKVLPEGKWNIINHGNHAICPFNNCGQVQRIKGLSKHLEREHENESVRQRLCQVRDCKEIVSISDLESHAATHSIMEYLMFWEINKVTKEVLCPECPGIFHLNRFSMLRHMMDTHGWSEWFDPPGGPPLCWLCEEKISLKELNKHLHTHELKINFLMD